MSLTDDNSSALVLFSGGQDSSTCLAWALNQFDRVETVGFDYGQRHRVELACRRTIRDACAPRFPPGRRGLVTTTRSTLRRSARSPRRR